MRALNGTRGATGQHFSHDKIMQENDMSSAILRKLALTCKALGICLSDPMGTKTQMNFLDVSLNLVLGNGLINPLYLAIREIIVLLLHNFPFIIWPTHRLFIQFKVSKGPI